MILCQFRVVHGKIKPFTALAFLVTGLGSLHASPKGFDSDPYTRSNNPPKEEQALLQAILLRTAKPQSGGESESSPQKPGTNLKEKRETAPPALCGDERAFSQRVFLETTTMPEGGKYAASALAMGQFTKSISLNSEGNLQIETRDAKPSFCSSATYLVFLSVLVEMQELGAVPSSKAINDKLLVHGQPDGVGIWGRWNANGPGTAMLIKELGMGENFVAIEKAIPGDFLKIWWTNEIGAKEHGHSVVYLGTGTNTAGEKIIKFWSSNIPGGYGAKEVPMTKVKNLLFSRITNPWAIQNVSALKPTNDFLASMISKSVAIEDVKKELGIK